MPSQKPELCAGCLLYDQVRISPRLEGPNKSGVNTSPVLFVGDYPALSSPQGGSPFQDRAGHIVGMLIRQLKARYLASADGSARWEKLRPYLTYAVQCTTDDKPSKPVQDQCRVHLYSCITAVKPQVVVTFGADATKSVFREKSKFSQIQGVFTPYFIQAPLFNFTLFPTYSPKAIFKQPGLFNEVLRDLQKVFQFVESTANGPQVISEEALRAAYRFPRTVEEVRLLCQEIIDYHNEGQDPERHVIGVDTETSSLEPHDPDAKIIMISFAWAKLKACAIVLDHPKGWWTPEELEQVKTHVKRVLACAKPKVLHNDKFDRQMIVHRYGWPLENVVWDTMGAEHLLEEDKKGVYGLKDLTRARLPEYAGYEDKVAEMREAHGGKTRAQEAKRFRKSEVKYAAALKDFAIRMEEYEGEYAKYSAKMDAWQARRTEEKTKAKLERRRMRKDKFGEKPKKPLRPRAPRNPEHEEPFDYTMIPLEDLELYAAVDPDVTRQHLLHQNVRFRQEYENDRKLRTQYKLPLLPPVRDLVTTHVIPTSQSLARMEFTGFPVNLTYLEELDAQLAKLVVKNEEWLFEAAERRFVTGNPQEVTTLLFSTGFYEESAGKKIVVPITPETKRTPGGNIAADAASLLYIANEYGYEFPKRIIALRKAQKARAPFLTNVREHARFDGRMHAQFHLTGTATGRLSSSEENLQNVPTILADFNIKDIFVPPEGLTLINTDAKGAEIRIFAAYSHDADLIKSLLDGLDTHSYFASKVFGLDYHEIEFLRAMKKAAMSAEQRDRYAFLNKKRTGCKRVVFGTLYGAMAAKIAETAGISVAEAQEIIDLMFKLFPSIPAYIEATHREIMLLKSVTTFIGRKRRFPMADMRMFRNRCFRQGVNCKIQATSSDIVLWVLNQLMPVVIRDLRGQFHATVHDSIVFSVPDSYVSQVPDLMYEYGTKRTQEHFPWMSVPFLWDVEAGRSYGSCENITDYLEKLNVQGKQHDTEQRKEESEEIITDDEFIQALTAE